MSTSLMVVARSFTLAVFLCVMVTPSLYGQKVPTPISKDTVMRFLKGDVPPHRVGEIARARGIDFVVTVNVERELRLAGATDELIAILKELAPKPRDLGPPSPGQVRVNQKDRVKYVWIPAGTFVMGCSPGDSDCGDDEKPPHQVTITKSFWLGQTEVTVGAYKRFAGATGRSMAPEPKRTDGVPLNPGWGNDAVPIVDVTWDDAQAYCNWSGGRLPTEAEWEYAARAGSTSSRYGDVDLVAWYADNSGRERLDSSTIKDDVYLQQMHENANNMHTVGGKRPNRFGLFDMLGNVSEWVSDWYEKDYYQNSPSQDPEGPTSGQWRVVRGGCHVAQPKQIRVSQRLGLKPGLKVNTFGFRFAGEAVNH